MSSKLRVWCFISAKGGVGKSTLAVATGVLLGQTPGRVPLLLDADLTGTSLGDGLTLHAPRLPQDELGKLLLTTTTPPPLYSLEETRDCRDRRVIKGLAGPYVLPYLNDAILHQASSEQDECQLQHLAWRLPGTNSLRVLPSSPARADINVALNWLYKVERGPWENRLRSLLELATMQIEGLTDLILDLPPGQFGFSMSALRALRPRERTSNPEAWEVYPVLLFSADRNDWLVALEGFWHLHPQFPRSVTLLNRLEADAAPLREEIRAAFLPHYGDSGLEKRVKVLRSHPTTLGQIFRTGHVPMDGPLARDLMECLPLEESR